MCPTAKYEAYTFIRSATRASPSIPRLETLTLAQSDQDHHFSEDNDFDHFGLYVSIHIYKTHSLAFHCGRTNCPFGMKFGAQTNHMPP